MVNRENILRVAQAIEDAAKPEAKPALGFNMARYFSAKEADATGHGCGTTACIAGWAHVLAGGDIPDVGGYSWGDRPELAEEFLGLTSSQGDQLFRSWDAPGSLKEIAPAHAVAVLRHFANTGKIDWKAAAPVPA